VKWRRIADVLMQRPVPPDDERSRMGVRLAELEKRTESSITVAHDQRTGAHSRLDAYKRLHLSR
jgi:hypothetical protein